MRKQFKEYIKENIKVGETMYNESDIKHFQKHWSFIEKECKSFIKEISLNNRRKNLLWRGMRGKGSNILLIDRRRDRRPKDTSPYWHDALDTVFDDRFGWKARSQGVFCGGYRAASGYGSERYMIFPVGKYRYLWSKEIDDLYSKIDDYNVGYDTETAREQYDEKYGEGNDGQWVYDETGWETGYSHIDDAVKALVDDRIEALTMDLEGLDEEDDSEEIDNIQSEINDLKNGGMDKEFRNSMEWQPSVDFDTFVDEEYEQSSSDYENAAESIIDGGDYLNDDIVKCLNDYNNNEIMLDVDKYFAIPEQFKDIVTAYVFDDNFDINQFSFDFMN